MSHFICFLSYPQSLFPDYIVRIFDTNRNPNYFVEIAQEAVLIYEHRLYNDVSSNISA
jgi:hypothetical protein